MAFQIHKLIHFLLLFVKNNTIFWYSYKIKQDKIKFIRYNASNIFKWIYLSPREWNNSYENFPPYITQWKALTQPTIFKTHPHLQGWRCQRAQFNFPVFLKAREILMGFYDYYPEIIQPSLKWPGELYTGNLGWRIIKNRVPLESNTTENYFDLIYPFLANGFIILIRPTSRVRARFNIAKA